MNLKIKKFYGINWALEDFVLEKDTALPNGTVLPAGERYFTWKDAMILQRIGAFPEGYRLPTARELRNLVKNVGPLTIRERLNFITYYGCRDRISNGGEKMYLVGENGFYWSSSSGTKYNAVALEVRSFGMGGHYAVGAWMKTPYRDYGNSIRLVYDPNN